MRKLLLFLMVLLASAPPLMAGYSVTCTINGVEAQDTPWPVPELTISANKVYEISTIVVLDENGEAVTNGVITLQNDTMEGDEPEGVGGVPGFTLSHDDSKAWNEGWTIMASEPTEEPVDIYITVSEDGSLPWYNVDYDPVGAALFAVTVLAAGEETITAPTFTITTDLGKKFGENDVFLSTASVTIVPNDNNPDGTLTYYLNSSEDIMTQTEKEDGKYEVTNEFPMLNEDGEQLKEYNILTSDGAVTRTVYVLSPNDIVLEDGEESYSYVGNATITETRYYVLNDNATELTDETGAIEINAADLEADSRAVNMQAVSLTETKFANDQTGDIFRLFLTGLKSGETDVELGATEENPVDLSENAVSSLDVEYSINGLSNLKDLGVTLYYTVGDGEATGTEDNTISLTDMMGVQKISAWLQKTDDETVKTEPVETFVKLYTPVAPVAPVFSTKRGPNTTEYTNGQEVEFDLNTQLFLTDADEGTTLYYTTAEDPSAEETEWTEYESGIALETPGNYTYTAKAVLNDYPSIVSSFTTLKVSVSSGVFAPSFYLNDVQNDPLSETETVDAMEGDTLIINFFNSEDDAEYFYTVKKEGDEEASAPIKLTDLTEKHEASIPLDKAGVFTYTGIATSIKFPDYSSSASVTINVVAKEAPTAPVFAINGETVILEEGVAVKAAPGDKLTITSSQSQELPYTITYTMVKASDEEGEEPAVQSEEGEDEGENNGETGENTGNEGETETEEPAATVYTKAITLNEEGTFTVTAKAYLTDTPDRSSESVMTLVVTSAPEAPTITINEEEQTVTIENGKNTVASWWALMTPDKEPTDEEAVAALEYTEVPEDGVVTPEGPGYIFAYSVAEAEEGAEAEKSPVAGGTDFKFAYDPKNLNLTLRLPAEYYDEANVDGVDGVYYNKVAAGTQMEMTLAIVTEGEDGAEYTAFPTYAGVVLIGLKIEGADATDATDDNNTITAAFATPGAFQLTAKWEAGDWYLAGETKVAADLNVFAVITNAEIEGGTAEEATLENEASVIFITIEESATAITFPVSEGGCIWYRLLNITNKQNVAGRIVTFAEEDVLENGIEGFTKSENGEVPLNGTDGSMLVISQTKEGITSPISQYYYGTEDAKDQLLKDIMTGISSVGADMEGVEFYDLNGYRVSGNQLKAGIYVRVQDGKATKVVVK